MDTSSSKVSKSNTIVPLNPSLTQGMALFLSTMGLERGSPTSQARRLMSFSSPLSFLLSTCHQVPNLAKISSCFWNFLSLHFSTVVLLQSFDPAWTALEASKLSDLRLGSLKSVHIAAAW